MTKQCDALQIYPPHYPLAPIINNRLFLTFAYCMIHTSRAESVYSGSRYELDYFRETGLNI